MRSHFIGWILYSGCRWLWLSEGGFGIDVVGLPTDLVPKLAPTLDLHSIHLQH